MMLEIFEIFLGIIIGILVYYSIRTTKYAYEIGDSLRNWIFNILSGVFGVIEFILVMISLWPYIW